MSQPAEEVADNEVFAGLRLIYLLGRHVIGEVDGFSNWPCGLEEKKGMAVMIRRAESPRERVNVCGMHKRLGAGATQPSLTVIGAVRRGRPPLPPNPTWKGNPPVEPGGFRGP